jgi:pimeloyl-ACP methyl ester carboxylesterase
VPIAPGAPGVLYEPAIPSPKSRIALFVMHSGADYLTFSACTELAKRGYRVLCANNSSDKSGTFDDGIIDKVLLEMRRGVTYLRHIPGIEKVVLFGHSGGATIMTAYQSIAENGVAVCQDTRKLHRCPDDLAELPPADGVVLADANFGIAEMALISLDPAIVDEANGTRLDPSLDMYNPANGFTPGGSVYSAAFERRFLAAEGQRETALITAAQARLAAIEAGGGQFTDDEPFVVPGASMLGFNNKLLTRDVRLLSHTRRAWPLLRGDGSKVTGIVHTVRVPENARSYTPSWRGALRTTVRNFLGSFAIRTTPDFGYDETHITGVDWRSTYSSPPGNVETIGVPLLALGMTAHWEMLAAEEIYDHSRSRDKSLVFVEGATHLYTPCEACAPRPGAFGDTVKTTYDAIDRWLGAGRFG